VRQRVGGVILGEGRIDREGVGALTPTLEFLGELEPKHRVLGFGQRRPHDDAHLRPGRIDVARVEERHHHARGDE
jgi:hypothetical protein